MADQTWLRAPVLGANDGILSTSSLVLGVAASGASASAIVIAGIAGLVAGASARPLQTARASALSFSAGAILPLLAVGLAPADVRDAVCVVVTLLALALLGDIGARLGGAPRLPAALRVVVWGALAMAITSGTEALVRTVS